MTRVYFVGVLLSLAHLHLVRTMKCGSTPNMEQISYETSGEINNRISNELLFGCQVAMELK